MPDDELEDFSFTNGGYVDPDEDAEFAAESPKGAVVSPENVGTTIQETRVIEPPEDEILRHRQIAYTDPDVHEAIETLTDWIVGDGFNIAPRSFESALESGVGQDASGSEETGDSQVQQLRRLMKQSNFWRVFNDWVRYALIDGHAYMEVVVEDEQFKPRLLPSQQVNRNVDEFGRTNTYVLEHPDEDDVEATEYEAHEVAELYFLKEPDEEYGRSAIEPIREQANILRDMEIDYARFIATKAYPPILWKLGNEERDWTESQTEAWMENVRSVEPDSMIAGPHDVEVEIVGTTSTSSSAGAMRLEETFKHLQRRIMTGLGLPAMIMNQSENTGESSATMPSFKRRIKRLQNIIKTAVERQILRSILTESALEEFDGVLPEFQFGEHSSAEKRLEVDKLLKLFNNGLLTPDALAERAGIDPNEVPEMWQDGNQMAVLQQLSGNGDNIQNPSGGSPSETGGGAESAGGEVTERQDGTTDPSSGRNQQDPTEQPVDANEEGSIIQRFLL